MSRLTLNSQTLLDKAIASRTQEVTITAQALVYLLPAIEAEARAELLAELREKVEALPEILEIALPFSVVRRAAVLALLSDV